MLSRPAEIAKGNCQESGWPQTIFVCLHAELCIGPLSEFPPNVEFTLSFLFWLLLLLPQYPHCPLYDIAGIVPSVPSVFVFVHSCSWCLSFPFCMPKPCQEMPKYFPVSPMICQHGAQDASKSITKSCFRLALFIIYNFSEDKRAIETQIQGRVAKMDDRLQHQ